MYSRKVFPSIKLLSPRDLRNVVELCHLFHLLVELLDFLTMTDGRSLQHSLRLKLAVSSSISLLYTYHVSLSSCLEPKLGFGLVRSRAGSVSGISGTVSCLKDNYIPSDCHIHLFRVNSSLALLRLFRYFR